MITKKAYAKVNLTLDITGRREDGYHLVRMVMQSLDIADILTFEKTNSGDIQIFLKDDRGIQDDELSNLGTLPLGEDNLVYRVARMMLEGYVWKKKPQAGVIITLEKHIPIAAGMAGGSSDAAATFKGMNELFELSLMDEQLMEMGVKFGADIPYCIMGGTALSEGIGEVLTRLPNIPECTFVVAKPKISVSTAEAYGGYDKMLLSGDKNYREVDVDGQVDAIYSGNLEGITKKFGNVLEYVTAENHPEIGQLEEIMRKNGALGAMMSGSGPTVFGIYDNEENVTQTMKALQESGLIEQLFISYSV